jgi:hypothetical protein
VYAKILNQNFNMFLNKVKNRQSVMLKQEDVVINSQNFQNKDFQLRLNIQMIILIRLKIENKFLMQKKLTKY